MNYKVCILAAGTGSRMGEFSKHLNKVLLPLNGKPVIGHIIEKFPEEIEIVIAVGHLKDSLMTYLKTAYPKRKLTFIHVHPYEGKGSGPGYSQLSCKDALQCPFIHVAGDTLVKGNIPAPNENWIGSARVYDTSRFCSIKMEKGKVKELINKEKTTNTHAYIGLLGVRDYETFWKALEENKEAIQGEIQMSNGISALLEKNLNIKEFTWFDTGTTSSYQHAIKNYPNGKSYQGE